MEHHDGVQPDSNGRPLSDDELASFQGITAQIGLAERRRAVLRSRLTPTPTITGVAALVATLALSVLSAVLAAVSLFAAAGCIAAMFAIAWSNLQRWSLMWTRTSAWVKDVLNTP